MSLGWKTFVLASLGIAVFLLNRRARRAKFEQFRDRHTRRKYRVPADTPDEDTKDDAS